MNFLNLSFGELLGLAGIVSAGIVALYLLDRTKRKQQRRYSKAAAHRLNRRDRGRRRRCRLHDRRSYVRHGQDASGCGLGRGRRDCRRAA